MKKITIRSLIVRSSLLLATLFLASSTFAQADSAKNNFRKEDTTRVSLGAKELVIIHKDRDTRMQINDRDSEKSGWRSGGFKGHWTGLELGLNNYLNKDYGMGPKNADEFMSLNSSRSINVNINFAQHSFGIVGNRFGMVTGLGFEFYNYFFRHNNTIVTDAQGIIVPSYYDPMRVDKSKLTMSYLTVPILFEFQFPGELSHSRRLRISVGVIGGLKLGSHTKAVYYVDGNKKKDKNHDDFSINPFRYGFTARVGYKHINIFTDFYPVPLFEKGKGPELYPISIGIAFVGH